MLYLADLVLQAVGESFLLGGKRARFYDYESMLGGAPILSFEVFL